MSTDSQQSFLLRALRSSAIFGGLPAQLMNELAQAMASRTVSSGELLLREGEPADSFIFVIRGALRAARRDAQGRLLVYNQIPPGQSVGEINMLLGQPRAQDVIALRDSEVAELSRERYEALLQRHPLEFSRAFMRALHDRLRHGSDSGEQGNRSHSLVLLPLQEGADLRRFAQDLTETLGQCLELPPERIALLAWDGKAQAQAINGQLLAQGALVAPQQEHDLLIYLADTRDSTWTRFAFRQADQLVFVSDANASPDLHRLEIDLLSEPGFPYKRKHLVLLHAPDSPEPVAPEPWRHGRELERIYPLRTGRAEDTARLARFLSSQAVGVVLGGGGARGFAHLGVLRAMQERGIPVDLIGGNSMGALIGAQFACEASLQDILLRTQAFASAGEHPTLPVVSLVSGARVRRDLKRLFGDREISRLWRPYFAAACNLTRGETAVLDRGPLWRAVLASNSPAGLLPPVLQDGELLVDGAILDNVPVQAMRVRLGTPLERRRGNGRIIAIDVDVREQLRADPSLERLTPTSTIRHKLRRDAPASPSINQILYSAGHVGGHGQRARTLAQADHFLEPPVADFALMAYGRAEAIVERGYEYAQQAIARWQLPAWMR